MARTSATEPPSCDLEARQKEWASDSETEAAGLAEANGGADAEGPQTFLFVRMGERVSFLELRQPGEWVLGRAADAHVIVEDAQASRQHAKLTLAAGVLSVEDLKSRNG